MKKGLFGVMKSYAKRCSPSTTKTTTPFQLKIVITSQVVKEPFSLKMPPFHLQRTPDFSHHPRSPPVPLDREDIVPRNRSLDNMHNPNLGPHNSTKNHPASSGHSGFIQFIRSQRALFPPFGDAKLTKTTTTGNFVGFCFFTSGFAVFLLGLSQKTTWQGVARMSAKF